MNTKLLIILGLVAMTLADTRPIYGNEEEEEDSSEESYESSEAKYSFNWAVSDDSSSNEFGHQEARDGDDTQGSYYVQLPDGRLQKVSYYIDGDDGYIAEVTYEGEAEYSEEDSDESDEDSEESYE